MKGSLRRLLLFALVVGASVGLARAASPFAWRPLPTLPEPLGVAGAFAGVVDGALVVAGGAHFPVSPFEGGTKVWVDRIWVLEPGADEWTDGGRLPQPLAYGASITIDQGVLLIGGSDSERHHPNVMLLRRQGGVINISQLPPLPLPLANHGAALLGDTIYVVGGQTAPDALEALNTVWAAKLGDLLNPVTLPIWLPVDPPPGPGRILPVVAAQEGSLYIFSGAELLADESGAPTRRFLSDGYRFTPGQGWSAVSGPPSPIVAAPAIAWGPQHIATFGGDDGSLFFRQQELGANHPGFPKRTLTYHTVTDRWADFGEPPFSQLTTTAVAWQGGVVIPSGEDRPGHRTPAVWMGAPAPPAAAFGRLDYLVLTLYLASLVAIGFFFSKRERGTDDFFLAGRRIPWWAAGLSIYGTQLSSISFIAMPAKVYATDWVYFLLQMTIIMVAFPVVWIYLPFFRRTNLTTAYEYLESRFNVGVRLFASAAFVLFQFGRMAIVLFLPSIALATVTGLNVYLCILLMGVLATAYTVMGGIEAVIWTDVVQVFVLLGGALLSLGVILTRIDGGLGGLISLGAANGKFHMFNWSWDFTTTAVWVVVVGNFFNNLIPYTSDQAVVQRYLTTPDEKSAARSIWTNAVLLLPSTLILFTLGTGLWAFYRSRPELLNPNLPADSVFPLFIAQQLPAGVSGLVIAGVFAASMSTLDSSLNSVATALTTDFYGRFTNATDAQKLRLARVLTALLGAVATGASIVLATFSVGSLWDTFQAAMGLFGGSLAGLFVLGIFTRRANWMGALTGAVSSIVILAFVQQRTPVHFFLYGFVGVMSCVIVGYLASLLAPVEEKPLEGLTLHPTASDNREA